ncbi:hypothetical protein NMY22_g400 [Coprinellus aureogranulatus]|nr:hypothetical protein NMY22_g400 [Coprinellus aureogranulatus]
MIWPPMLGSADVNATPHLTMLDQSKRTVISANIRRGFSEAAGQGRPVHQTTGTAQRTPGGPLQLASVPFEPSQAREFMPNNLFRRRRERAPQVRAPQVVAPASAPPSYNEVTGSAFGEDADPLTWRDISALILGSGIVSWFFLKLLDPRLKRQLQSLDQPGASSSGTQRTRQDEPTQHTSRVFGERLLTSALILASTGPQVREELTMLFQDFDEAWVDVQDTAYAFHDKSRALANCGRRLYAIQQHYYSCGHADLALAIDPFLETVQHRMPHLRSTGRVSLSTGA